jgi:hypothetical protein
MSAAYKTDVVRLRLTPLEKAKLKELADKHQKNMSDYLRYLISLQK